MPQIGITRSVYSSARLATTASPAMVKPNIAAAVSDVSSTMVFLLLQNPYIQATTNVKGSPIRAESRRMRSAVTSANPSLRRFEGIHRLNPNSTSPTPMPSSAMASVWLSNGGRNSWIHRLLTSCSTSSSERSSTIMAP